jgi:hypothetical protein
MSFDPDDDPDDDQVAAPAAGAGPGRPPAADAGPTPMPARRPWSAWAEVRADLRSAAGVVGALAVTGIPAGLLWWALAPRADFRITAEGPQPIGDPSPELLAGDDVVFAVLLAAVGLLAGVLAWSFLRRHRGVATLLAVTLGTAASAAVAWQVGELLGPGPSRAELAHVGARVTTSLHLGSLPALAVGPFFAVLAYLVAALVTRRDDLGRPARPGVPASALLALPAERAFQSGEVSSPSSAP